MQSETAKKPLEKHHIQQQLCETRPPYRQGKKLTAVKIYTINSESQHLYIYGVPKINLRNELKSLCMKYGPIKNIHAVPDVEVEKFTECYHVHYERLPSARIAKRVLDTRSFYGGLLHVCYAPECETLEETRAKLNRRKVEVARKISECKLADTQETSADGQHNFGTEQENTEYIINNNCQNIASSDGNSSTQQQGNGVYTNNTQTQINSEGFYNKSFQQQTNEYLGNATYNDTSQQQICLENAVYNDNSQNLMNSAGFYNKQKNAESTSNYNRFQQQTNEGSTSNHNSFKQQTNAGNTSNYNRLQQQINAGRTSNHNSFQQQTNAGSTSNHNSFQQQMNTGNTSNHNSFQQKTNEGSTSNHNSFQQQMNTGSTSNHNSFQQQTNSNHNNLQQQTSVRNTAFNNNRFQQQMNPGSSSNYNSSQQELKQNIIRDRNKNRKQKRIFNNAINQIYEAEDPILAKRKCPEQNDTSSTGRDNVSTAENIIKNSGGVNIYGPSIKDFQHSSDVTPMFIPAAVVKSNLNVCAKRIVFRKKVFGLHDKAGSEDQKDVDE